MKRPVTPVLTGVLAMLCVTGIGRGQTSEPAAPVLPHIHIDDQKRFVDLDATVVNRQAPWLELLACSPKGREHETILTVAARPSHVHLALVLISLEPGAPMRWRREEKEIITEPPRGPRVRVSILFQQDGQQVEVPAGDWITDATTGKPLSDSVWLFAGSRFEKLDDRDVYVADVSGSVISLVNFGDDVLTRPTDKTNMSDQEQLKPRVEAIPPTGTPVKLRLRPVIEEQAVK